ncbi:MAG TPA: helicase-associated domain-containing protein [Kofleriaceae bacterium]|nr:helicase-associated domain-containing protein [Kofleriaceae bacterium]
MMLYNAFPLAQIDDVSLASMLHVPRKDVAKARQAFVTRYRDPASAEAVLQELPAPSLVVLACLVDAGGMMSIVELEHTLHGELGMTRMDLQRAVSPLAERLLAVPLSSHRGDKSMLALVAPAAQAIAPHLVDLDIAPGNDAPFVADPERAVDGRALLAVCMALRHVDIKRTTENRPHRGGSKRLAKAIGVDELVLEKIIEVAASFDLLAIDGDGMYRPNTTALADAAVGRYHDPIAAALVERIERGPVSIGILDRWRRRLIAQFFDTNALALLPGFITGTLGGLAAIARGTRVESAMGHVTPSFEVLLPPESRLSDIVAAVGCSELVRVDRVIVGKLTQASVARAVTAGMTGREIVDALAAASKVPIPQNVEAAVQDWANSVASADVVEGVVVVVDPRLGDRVRNALTGLSARELGHGAFLIGDDVPRRSLDAALARAGVQPRRELVSSTPQIARREIPPIDQGSPTLRARVAAWRREDPAERARDAAVGTFVPLGPESGIPSVTQVNDAVEALAVWERAYRRLPADELKMLIALFSMIQRTLWQPILDRATNPEQLRVGVAELANSGQIDDVLEAGGLRRTNKPITAEESPWYDDHIVERLSELDPDELVAIEHDGRITELVFDRVIRRGAASLVLGSDEDTGDDVAIRIDTITRFSRHDEMGLDPEADDLPRGPYLGPPVAGHLGCPCGSGKRYRDCCRGAAS